MCYILVQWSVGGRVVVRKGESDEDEERFSFLLNLCMDSLIYIHSVRGLRKVFQIKL